MICAGGGGIPTMYDEHGKLHGVEAVIDKDLASALLAEQLDADLLVIATDVDGVYTGWGTPKQARLGRVTPDELAGLDLPAGSMGPKVQAACGFARNTGNEAVIGSLTDIAKIVDGHRGNPGERMRSHAQLRQRVARHRSPHEADASSSTSGMRVGVGGDAESASVTVAQQVTFSPRQRGSERDCIRTAAPAHVSPHDLQCASRPGSSPR